MSQPDYVLLPPPFAPIEGILNCRTLPFPANQPLKLFRAGDISHITLRGKTQLKEHGISQIFDLRSPSDVARFNSPSPAIEGVQTFKTPLFLDHNVEDQENLKNGEKLGRYEGSNMRNFYVQLEADELATFMKLYARFLDDGRHVIAQILRAVICLKKDEGILFHCSAGKDRTGVVAAIILSIAGIDDRAIIDDYALTESGLKPYQSMIMAAFEKDAAFQENREGGMRMLSSRPETMQAFLTLLREKWGGAYKYVKDIAGLSAEELERLQKRLQSGHSGN